MIALAPTPVLMTARLTLRAPEGGDVEAWVAFATSDRSRYIGGPLSRALAWRAWGHVIGHWAMRSYGMFVLVARTEPDRPLGMAGPWYPDGWPEREIGWTLWSDADEGRGYAREAAEATRDHVFGALVHSGQLHPHRECPLHRAGRTPRRDPRPHRALPRGQDLPRLSSRQTGGARMSRQHHLGAQSRSAAGARRRDAVAADARREPYGDPTAAGGPHD